VRSVSWPHGSAVAFQRWIKSKPPSGGVRSGGGANGWHEASTSECLGVTPRTRTNTKLRCMAFRKLRPELLLFPTVKSALDPKKISAAWRKRTTFRAVERRGVLYVKPGRDVHLSSHEMKSGRLEFVDQGCKARWSPCHEGK
jgi:hypothetical protein